MSTTEWQEIIGQVGAFVLVLGVVTLSIWQFAASRRARAVMAREHEYRALADNALVAQQTTERQLADVSARLAEMHPRLQSLERILKDVE